MSISCEPAQVPELVGPHARAWDHRQAQVLGADVGNTIQEAHMSATNGMVDMHLEVDIIPVSDVDRSKAFYERLGWRFDADDAPTNDVRIVQFTPPGSGCSVTFGKGITATSPGSAEGGLIVSDIEAAHDAVVACGVDASEMWHGATFPPKHGSAAPTPSTTATGRSSPSTIPTAMPG